MERTELEKEYGKVWNTQELQQDFKVLGFQAPHIACIHIKSNRKGSMKFQHRPRYYFSFVDENGKGLKPLTIGDVLGIKSKEDVENWVFDIAKKVLPKDIAEEIKKHRKSKGE